MGKTKGALPKDVQRAGASDLRSFRRRKLVAQVEISQPSDSVVTGTSANLSVGGLHFSSSQVLNEGTEAQATITLGTGARITTPVHIVWKSGSDSGLEYGLRFIGLTGEQQQAMMDAVYAPPSKSGADALFDAPPGGATETAERKLSPAHYAYYMRLIHRIEQTHALSLSNVDRLLFAVLRQGRDLASTLLELGLTTYDKLESYLGALYGVPYVSLSLLKPDVGISDVIPESVAISQNVVPIQRLDGTYLIAMADPLDLPTRDIIHLRTKNHFEIRFALIEDVEKAVKAIYQAASLHSADRLIDEASAAGKTIELYKEVQDVADLETLRRLSDATPIISLVDSVLRSAVE